MALSKSQPTPVQMLFWVFKCFAKNCCLPSAFNALLLVALLDWSHDWSSLGKLQKKQKRFFGEIFPKCGWVGWLFPKQGPNPSNPPTVPQEGDIFDCFRNAFFPVCMINLGYSTHVFSMGTFLFQLMSNTRTFKFFNGQKLSKMWHIFGTFQYFS